MTDEECPHCGDRPTAADDFCLRCGEDMTVPPSPPRTPAQKAAFRAQADAEANDTLSLLGFAGG